MPAEPPPLAAEDYRALVLGLPGGPPLAYWRFSDISSILDERPGARHGNWDGAVSLVSGLPQNSDEATALPGTVVGRIPHDAGLALSALTFSLWVRFSNTPTDPAVILSKDARGLVAGDFSIWVQEGGAFLRIVFQSDDDPFPIDLAFPPVGQAFHLAVTASASGVEVWLNGKHMGTRTDYTGGLAANVQPILLGIAQWTQHIGAFVLDEVALYSRVLADAEIVTLSQRTAAPMAAAVAAGVQSGQTVVVDVAEPSRWVGRKSALAMQITGNSTHGRATVTGGKDISYTADPGLVNPVQDTVSFTITDANGTSAPGTVTIDGQPAASDAYAARIFDVGAPLAYWRLNDANTTLVDHSGNGRNGTYAATPSQVSELTFNPGAGNAVNFAGANHGEVAHHASFELQTGMLAFKFRVPAAALSANATLLHKGPDFVLSVQGTRANRGNLRLKIGNVVRETRNTAGHPGTIIADREHHCIVYWNAHRMWLIIDGYRARRTGDVNAGGDKGVSGAWTAGLTGNTKAWRFGISPGDVRSSVRLGEVVLYDRQPTWDDICKLYELDQRFVSYVDPDGPLAGTITVVGPFDTVGDIKAAVEAASPNTHVLVAAGTYGAVTFAGANGSKLQPIVVRPADTANRPTINGSWSVEGCQYLVIAGMNMTGNGDIRYITNINRYCRVTGCRDVRFTTSPVRFEHAHDCRVDRCEFTRRGTGNFMLLHSQGSRWGSEATRRLLIDRNLAHDFGNPEAGGASEAFYLSVSSGSGASGSWSGSLILENLLDDVRVQDENEVLGGKVSGVQHIGNTVINSSTMYVQSRKGSEHEYRSNWFGQLHSKGMRLWGCNCVVVGNRITHSTMSIGDSSNGNDLDEIYDVTGQPPYNRGPMRGTLIIGNMATGSGAIHIGAMAGGGTSTGRCRDNRLEANTGTIINGEGALTETLEPYDDAEQLTTAAVGRAAPSHRLTPKGYL